jgi:hypothetical protein
MKGPVQPELFWAKTDRSGGPEACWPWLGAKNAKGYGSFSAEKKERAHRLAFRLANPETDIAGKFVCHSCDNPGCVNPAHLWLGTNEDNVADKVAKGRQVAGDRHGMAKLTTEKVKFIRESGLRTRELAELFSVNRSTILCIRKGNLWADA